MSRYQDNRYDEIKSLLKKSRLIYEQTQINIGKSIEDKIKQDTSDEEPQQGDEEEITKKDKTQKYRISGGILSLHGKNKGELDITTDEKVAFQETMDEFVNEVSDLADFNELNVYPNNVEWSGKIIDEDLEFVFSIGETSGVYINGTTVKVDDEFLELMNKLKSYYEKFKSKWSKVLSVRKKTETNE